MEFPQRFGKYTLLKRIATGGMADIFLAHMRSLQGFEKEVVVKRLRPEHAANPDLVGMFLDEARTAANLTHANVAQIFDLGGRTMLPGFVDTHRHTCMLLSRPLSGLGVASFLAYHFRGGPSRCFRLFDDSTRGPVVTRTTWRFGYE